MSVTGIVFEPTWGGGAFLEATTGKRNFDISEEWMLLRLLEAAAAGAARPAGRGLARRVREMAQRDEVPLRIPRV